MKTILVPSDFSTEAKEAYAFALQIAAKSGGSVHVLKAIELPVVYEGALGSAPYYFDPNLLKELNALAQSQFEKLKSEYPSNVPVAFHAAEGPVTPVVRQFIQDHHVDLVVMGTRGASGIEEILIGSNTEKIVRFSPVPVIAIRKSVPLQKIRNIVFPTLLDAEPKLIAHIQALQKFFDAKLHVVIINTPYNMQRSVDEEARMKNFASENNLSNFTLQSRNEFHEPEGILAFAREIKADLIAMGTHGRRGLAHFFTGSIAEKVVNHVETPIWTLSSHS